MIHHPMVSGYEWCPRCRNWFKIVWRKVHGDTTTEIQMACAHRIARNYNPNMDGLPSAEPRILLPRRT